MYQITHKQPWTLQEDGFCRIPITLQISVLPCACMWRHAHNGRRYSNGSCCVRAHRSDVSAPQGCGQQSRDYISPRPKCGMLDGMQDLACYSHCSWLMQASEHVRALREFTCTLCKGVLVEPLSTPCGHHFCKPCLEKKYEVRHSQLFCRPMKLPGRFMA